MTNQQTLFSDFAAADAKPAPHVRTSDTSRAAAKSISQEAMKSQELIVLNLIGCSVDGLTDEQIAMARPDIKDSSLRRARVMLTEKGFVKDSEREHENISGRKATVWVEVVKARKYR